MVKTWDMKRTILLIFMIVLAFLIVFLGAKDVHAETGPAKVTGVKVSKIDYYSVGVSWEKTKRATGYAVYMKTSGQYKKIVTLKGYSYTVKKLGYGTEYTFKVRAYRQADNKKIWGKYSAAVKVTTDQGYKRSYTIAHVNGEPDWDMVPKLDIDNQQWLEHVDITAHAQLCYSDDSLYVHMWAEEANIRAVYPKSNLLAPTYEDSCLEFFILPVANDARYMNFEFNPNCCVGAGIGKTKEERVRIIPEPDQYEAVSDYTENGWEIYYKIPFDYIREFFPGFTPRSGQQLRGNFYKCGNLTVKKHYITWNLITSEKPNFHCPEDFGILIFE